MSVDIMMNVVIMSEGRKKSCWWNVFVQNACKWTDLWLKNCWDACQWNDYIFLGKMTEGDKWIQNAYEEDILRQYDCRQDVW